ncbi:MAG: cysteine desulfurase family protein [Planctomycetales bacterium]
MIYLDNNSTTPLDRTVLDAMLPYLTTKFGNASNTTHDYGSEAARAVDRARMQVASLLGADPKEIVFTSGATESNNLAILGAVRGSRQSGDHVITTRIEHKAILNPCRQLEREGVKVTYLPVDTTGYLHAEAVAEAITDRTVLVSVMAANNEVGTLLPVAEIGRICKERDVLFHSDAVQALGRVPVDAQELGVDLLSVSAHKMYGPKGVGALYVRGRSPAVRLEPLVYGGGQERGLRSGTIPVPNVVALGVASELAGKHLATEPARLRDLRERLRERISSAVASAVVHGHPGLTLPGLLNIGFPEVDGDVLIHSLRGVALSQGSSCSAGSFEPSHVLRALGVGDALARASIRMGVGRFSTPEEIDSAAELIVKAIRSLGEVAN